MSANVGEISCFILYFIATVMEDNSVVAQRLAKKDLSKPIFYTFVSGGYGELSINKLFANFKLLFMSFNQISGLF